MPLRFHLRRGAEARRMLTKPRGYRIPRPHSNARMDVSQRPMALPVRRRQSLLHPDQIPDWPLSIVVPFPPESEASGIGDRGFHRACWYERDFDIDIDIQRERVLLRFGAADYAARVWVNGHLVVTHEGGHTPFFADISHVLDASGKQRVTVFVEDDPQDLTKPRGKQDWQLEPHSIWYPRTTGLWQTVWVEKVARTYIEKIRWTPHVDSFAIGLDARITGDAEAGLTLEVSLKHGERVLARDVYQVLDREVDRVVILADPGIDDFRNELRGSPKAHVLDAAIRLLRGDEGLMSSRRTPRAHR